MLARQILCKKLLRYSSCSCVSVRHTQSASEHALDTINLETRLPVSIKRQRQREPFAKNLFLGVFDHEFMYYPEPQTKERHTRFFEWLQPIERYVSEKLEDPQTARKDDILSHLRDLGVFRAHVEEQHFGLSLNETELAKLVEVLSCLPWLGSYIIQNHIVPVHIISTMASEEQKAKYLPRIATGEIVPTVCYTESEGGINIRNINTKSEMSDCDTHYILNGEKSFVVNGHDSNLFLVFSHFGHSQAISSGHGVLSVFLVERDTNGIVCKDIKNLVGLHNSPVCTVTFNNTKIPKDNLLGDIKSGRNILIDSLAPGNRNIAPQAVGMLRTFIKLLTKHVLERKHLDQNLHEYESVQEVIGRLSSSLYSMESMLYYTTGIIDMYENQDCTLEKAMVEMYCANKCVTSIYEGLQIIGVQSYLREKPYIQIFEDVLSYTLFDSYNIDSNIYISLLGLQHVGKNLRQHIIKIRNPFNYPKHMFNWVFGKDYRLNLHIADHLHPSLVSGGEILEKCIGRLQTVAVLMLQRHGTEISDRQMELRRISELAMKTFALVTVLSRTSRAYCIGVRNADLDRQLANIFAILTENRVKAIADEILLGEFTNGDKLHKNVAELIYGKKDYFAEHPLNRTY
ncbi:acyl-CoA dehydrogenase family member 9, mitochondrial-like [Nylanderia fulva]|uniref:acyl-CoA dehydrogenase family member 9, mitochondrial-like n=1 Tax=Nylanderia fulva TaxID=613905 RepID=UPI0010FB519D|nr:acyl-CoA dehydrogenase family member 9, mitochondrial-like [Nylanderia fulva]